MPHRHDARFQHAQDAVIQLPGLPFSVRCGRNAIHEACRSPPDSGLLQVNNNSGACRIVDFALHGAGLRAERGESRDAQPLTSGAAAAVRADSRSAARRTAFARG